MFVVSVIWLEFVIMPALSVPRTSSVGDCQWCE